MDFFNFCKRLGTLLRAILYSSPSPAPLSEQLSQASKTNLLQAILTGPEAASTNSLDTLSPQASHPSFTFTALPQPSSKESSMSFLSDVGKFFKAVFTNPIVQEVGSVGIPIVETAFPEFKPLISGVAASRLS